MHLYDARKSATKADRAVKHSVVSSATAGAPTLAILAALRTLLSLPWPAVLDPAIAVIATTAASAVSTWFSIFRADKRKHFGD